VQKTTKLKKKMKQLMIKCGSFFSYAGIATFTLLLLNSGIVFGQADEKTTRPADTSADAGAMKKSPVKNTFESNLLIDNQTVMVPAKGTLGWDIQHRFGTVNNGYQDFYGIFAPALIRLGFEYVPVKYLQVGFGLCSERLQLDLNVKYALVKQMKEGMPVSITYFGNMVIDTRRGSNFVNGGDRLSYFDQLMVARKFCPKFSAQASLSLSHFNNVPGYYDANGVIQNSMKNDQFTFSVTGRYKLSNQMSVLINIDQPLTQNAMSNPHPNVAAGLEIATSSHCFQIIVGNCQHILPQNNALYNQNDYTKGQYLLGFNMTKLWNL
jgi:Membrane bound beta barrel domain (DUF5777)